MLRANPKMASLNMDLWRRRTRSRIAPSTSNVNAAYATQTSSHRTYARY